MKKGMELSLTVIIVAALLLIVLIVLIAIFMGGTRNFTDFISGGKCTDPDQCLTRSECRNQGGIVGMKKEPCMGDEICCNLELKDGDS